MRATAPAVLAVCVMMVVGGCSGTEVFTAGRVDGYLYQVDAGLPTYVRLTMTNGSIDPADVKAWLIYRGRTAGFPAEADNLVAVLRDPAPGFYDDDAQSRSGLTSSFTFTYLDAGGQATATVDITYDHPPLVAGETYYYKVRRIVDPNVVVPPPAQTAQVTTSFQIDPAGALGEASPAVGPITYLQPPVLQEPADGVQAASPTEIDFVWQPTAGATDYRLEISTSRHNWQVLEYRADVPYTGGSLMRHTFRTTHPLQAGQPYYWRVGARVAGQRAPQSGSSRGYIYSAVRSFRVPLSPPSPPS